MLSGCCKPLDPRTRRTRQLLHDALETLLETRDFGGLSIQDIADAATVNRATFYDHYPDKSALLEATVAHRFHDLLARRGVTFDGTCLGAARALILGVCDFLAGPVGIGNCRERRLEPHLESAMVAVLRAMLLAGFQQHPVPGSIAPELRAATVGWAIYGGVKEWVQISGPAASEQGMERVWELVSPLLGVAPDAR